MAYRLGAAVDQHVQDTQALLLQFSYDSSQPSNRKQFTLDAAKLLLIDRLLAINVDPSYITQLGLKSGMQGRWIPSELAAEDSQVIVPMLLVARDIGSSNGPSDIVFGSQIFGLERSTNEAWIEELMSKDWVDVITRSLKGPAPRVKPTTQREAI